MTKHQEEKAVPWWAYLLAILLFVGTVGAVVLAKHPACKSYELNLIQEN